MKKNKTTDTEQKRKPRRLSLNRETLLVLKNPALLELPRGGEVESVVRDCAMSFQEGGCPRTGTNGVSDATCTC